MCGPSYIAFILSLISDLEGQKLKSKNLKAQTAHISISK